MPFSLTRRDASAHVSWLARGSLCALALFCLSTARAVEPSKLSASLASTTVGTFNVKLSPVLLSGIGSAVFANTPVSGGVSQLGAEGLEPALKQADQALYAAKRGGRDQMA